MKSLTVAKCSLLLLLGFVVSAAILPAQESVGRSADGKVVELTLRMSVAEINLSAKNGIKILTRGTGNMDKLELVISTLDNEITKKNTGKADASYEFPLSFIAPPASKELWDAITEKYFGKGATLFKRGYVGGAFSRLSDISDNGGTLFVSDVGIDGKVFWSMTIDIDAKTRGLTLAIREKSY